MNESVWSQLRRLITEGASPTDATEVVMADLPPRWQDWSRPFVLRAASGVEGQVVNRQMRRALAPTHAGSRHREQAALTLHTTVYRLPDGTRVLWDDMTVDMLDLKIAQLRKHIGSLVDHLHILEAARKLCADRGVSRLGEIDGWEELVRASAEADTPAGVGAREPVTGEKRRRKNPKVIDGTLAA